MCEVVVFLAVAGRADLLADGLGLRVGLVARGDGIGEARRGVESVPGLGGSEVGFGKFDRLPAGIGFYRASQATETRTAVATSASTAR
ncbi:hypothetical protein AXG53_02100 [Stenotrophomonas sp. KCTC 12332]|nr:hypothetical protein AXG53_02100 [Stenotrophomonas sp. KCTC 12332]